jgi:hypothetical protein
MLPPIDGQYEHRKTIRLAAQVFRARFLALYPDCAGW